MNFANLKSDGTADGTRLESEEAEARALTITDLKMINGLMGPDTNAGHRVTAESALRFIPVFSAVNRLATDVAALPINVLRRRPGGGKDTIGDHPANRLLNLSPDGETTAMRFRQALMGHVLTCDRGAYAEIEWTKDGQLGALYLLDPKTTRAERTPQSKKLYYRVDNGRTLPPYKVLHIAGLGFNGLEQYSMTALGAQGIGLGVAAEAFGGSFFRNGSRPSGAIKHPGKLKEDARAHLRQSWQNVQGGSENVGKTAILDEGMDWIPFTMTPEEGQYGETRKYQRTEVAALYSTPPHKIGDFSQAHLANIESSNRDYVETSLLGWLKATEAECNLKLFRRDEQDAGLYAKHNLNALLRGNIAVRSQFYKDGIANGWFTVDEVRELEDMNPIGKKGGGRKHFIALNLQTLDAAGVPKPEPEPTPAPDPDPGDPEPEEPAEGEDDPDED